jgi:hypothetical protein
MISASDFAGGRFRSRFSLASGGTMANSSSMERAPISASMAARSEGDFGRYLMIG